ncbi:CsgG/HfaB family protein [Longibacter sp.]|uniref:CsgG/HfaB family protein n=1 Tax=Longibacter sp. TaxID=2045415 RepID=UPI003EBD257F
MISLDGFVRSIPPRVGAMIRLAIACVFVATVGLGLAHAQTGEENTGQETDDLFEQAQSHYQEGAFDEAAELFATVAETTPYRERKREALKYLGRTHIIRDNPEQARLAMTELLRLEPPMIELDPDVEPPPIMNVYYEARRDLADNPCWTGKKQPDGSCYVPKDIHTLAIIDFSNNSIDQKERFEGLKWGLPTMFVQHMSGATQLRLIERERLEWIKQEIGMSEEGIMDPQTAAEAGRLLGATNVMLGSYMIFDGQITIWSRLVETETGRIRLGRTINGKVDEFHGLTRELSQKMATAIDSTISLTDPTETGSGPSKSLDAMLAYSDALKLIEDGDYARATQKLKTALRHDPDYIQAQRRLESLRPMLASASEDGAADGSR